MVTNDARNNIIVLVMIAAVGILVISSLAGFFSSVQLLSENVSNQIDGAVKNITSTTTILSEEIDNLTRATGLELVHDKKVQADRDEDIHEIVEITQNQSHQLETLIKLFNASISQP